MNSDDTAPWRGSTVTSRLQLVERALAFHRHLCDEQPTLVCADICMMITHRVQQLRPRMGLNGLLDFCDLYRHKALFVGLISHAKERTGRSYGHLTKWQQVDTLACIAAQTAKSKRTFMALTKTHAVPIQKTRRLIVNLKRVLRARELAREEHC